MEAKEVVRLCRWFLATHSQYKRLAMFCGGFDAVINDTYIAVQRTGDRNRSVKWTTFWINNLRWTIFRLYKAHRRERLVQVERSAILERQFRVEIFEPDLKERISFALKFLTPRERGIIVSRYGLGGRRRETLEELARVWGVTREGIRSIEQKALHKLALPHCGLGRFTELVTHRCENCARMETRGCSECSFRGTNSETVPNVRIQL